MKPYLSQIAFSVSNLERSIRFYREMLELDDAGGVTAFRGPLATYVQGIKGIASRTHWLQDDRKQMQLEFFEFEYPPIYPITSSKRSCDIGLTRVAFEVADVELLISKARSLGAKKIQGPLVFDGTKHAVLEDPDGILVELIEAPDKLPFGRFSRVAGIALSVANLAEYLKIYTQGFSQEIALRPHVPIDSLLELEGTKRKVAIVESGYGWLEISEYISPCPAPRRAGHLLTDIGLSHIAYSCSSMKDFNIMYRKLVDEKWLYPHNLKPMKTLNLSACMYSKDREGFTIETIYMSSLFHGMFGFTIPGLFDRFSQFVMNTVFGLLFGKTRAKKSVDS